MDACGPETVANVGKIALINLNDVATRTKLLSFACWVGQQRVTRHPNTADYQLALRLAFTQWGLPQRLSVDHDSVFFDNQTPSPYPTRWHLWLLALGVTVCFGRVHCPTDQAVTERSHQTWYHQVLEGQRFDTLDHLQHALDDRREFLNTHLPCRSLAEQPPLLAYPEARQSQRPYRPEWEAHLLDLHRVYDYLAKGVWYRRMSNVGAFSLGGQVYVAGLPWARQQVEIFFDPQDCHLVVTAPAVKLTKRFSLKGVTPQELMGELGPLAHLSEFQLALPFTWPDVRVLKLNETLGVKT